MPMDAKQRDELERLLSRIKIEKKCEVTPVKLQPSLLVFLKKRYGNVSKFVRESVIQRLEGMIASDE